MVTYTGADEHTGRRRPPAVPARRAARRPRPHHRARRCASRWSSEHPLQPFDVRNRRARAARRAGPVHLRPRHARGRARRSPAPRARAAVPGPDPAAPPTRRRRPTSSLDDLVAFLRDPVKGFFRALDVTLPWEADGVGDAMPVEIDAPGVLGRRRPDARATCCAGPTPTPPCDAEWRRGHAAAGPAGVAQGRARCATRPRSSPGPRSPTARSRPRLRRRRRRCAAAAGSPAPSPRCTATGSSRGATPSWPASTSSSLGTAARAGRARPRPQLDRPGDRPAGGAGPASAQRLLGPPDDGALSAARGPRRPLRRRAPGAAAAAGEDLLRLGHARGTAGDDPVHAARPQVARAPLPRRGRRARPRAGVGPARAAGRLLGSPAPASRSRARAPGSAPWRPGCGCRCCAARCGCDRPATPAAPTTWSPSTCSGALPERAHHHRAGGQRRHRQDLHPGRPGHPLRRRGRGHASSEMLLITFGRAASQELRERVRDQLVEAPTRARRRAAGSEPDAAARAASPALATCSTPTPRAGRPRAAAARRAGRLRRRHHRHHPPVLPARAPLAGRGRRHRRRRHPGRGPRRPASPRSSTTSTCAASARAATTRCSPAPRRSRWPARPSRNPRHRADPARPRARAPRPAVRWGSRATCSPSSSAASAASACSATTTS